jgi:DNA-binding FadR family transcriptional regulator
MNFQTILLPAFNYVYDSGLINRPLKKKKHVSHKELVEILKTGSPKKFREGMRKHLDNHFDRLFE